MRYLKIILALLCFIAGAELTAQELRGTWIARNSLSSKDALAAAIDSLAKNNFNVIYINLWSRGYPLWQSDVFFNETGLYIDPTYQTRDILAETIAEAHRHGIHVEAWFEYGFVGGWTGNQPAGVKGPIFQAHPDWVAKKKDGTEIDGSNFYWMVHTRRDVQDFLIALCTEVVRNYDLDGIELDRIRYSSLEYGYDSYTDSLYRAENNGNPPPVNVNDPVWLRWRADKLNDFMARAYDSIKTINPNINVSNAPSLYSSSSYTSFNSFCQDWAWWVNNDKVDNVQVQMYVGSAATMSNILDYLHNNLTPRKTKVFPAIAIKPGSTTLPLTEIGNMITLTRQKGYGGNAIWFYSDLPGVFPYLKANFYQAKTHPPFSPADWREIVKTVPLTDTANIRLNGTWAVSTLPGLTGTSLSTSMRDSASIEYYVNVSEDGWYEVNVYNVIAVNRSDSANYRIYDKNGQVKEAFVDQSRSENRRWLKLGDVQLQKGRSKVVELTSRFLDEGKVLSADAVYIKLNRRLSPDVVSGLDSESRGEKKSPEKQIEIGLFPNPAKDYFKYSVFLKNEPLAVVSISDLLGQKIWQALIPEGLKTATGRVDISDFASGVYFVTVNQGDKVGLAKLLIQK